MLERLTEQERIIREMNDEQYITYKAALMIYNECRLPPKRKLTIHEKAFVQNYLGINTLIPDKVLLDLLRTRLFAKKEEFKSIRHLLEMDDDLFDL